MTKPRRPWIPRWRFKPGSRVEMMADGDWDGIVHVVKASGEAPVKVMTLCRRLQFRTSVRPKRKAVSCMECIAKEK